MTHFTTREAARILELSEARIRSCVRAGLISPRRGPGRQWQFTFQDLLLLKTTKSLLDARVPLARIRRLLGSLRRQLPEDPNLASLTIYADGRRIVAWDGTARWQPDSGQFLFNFDAEEVARKIDLPMPTSAPAGGPQLSSEEWFDLASELESTSQEEARAAYHQALDLDPTMTDAHVNLGRLYHEGRDYASAEAHYRSAIKSAPSDPVPHFNLGVLLEELGRRSEAVTAYRQAITHDPDFADAHYNLGFLYDALGRRSQAMTHLRIARKLYGR